MIQLIRKALQYAADDGDDAGAISRVASYIFGYDASNEVFDRLRSGITDFVSYQLEDAIGNLRSIPIAQYLATRPVMQSGYFTTEQVNQRGDRSVQEQYLPDYEDNANDVAWVQTRALPVNTGAWTNYNSGTTKVGTAGISIKTTAGCVRRIAACNTHASTEYWLLLVNKASAPVANDAAISSIPLADVATGNFGMSGNNRDFGARGLYLSAGVAVAISTTPEKVTLPGSSDCVIEVEYI